MEYIIPVSGRVLMTGAGGSRNIHPIVNAI